MIVDKLIPYLKQGKYGFCNHNKEIVIPCEYDLVVRFWSNRPISMVRNRQRYGTR
ncbi:MAG: WG repeat-containing protein [Bacteroidia bacterium]|nr:WG repeat-containing protein [Bacteroidia bacterium]